MIFKAKLWRTHLFNSVRNLWTHYANRSRTHFSPFFLRPVCLVFGRCKRWISGDGKLHNFFYPFFTDLNSLGFYWVVSLLVNLRRYTEDPKFSRRTDPEHCKQICNLSYPPECFCIWNAVLIVKIEYRRKCEKNSRFGCLLRWLVAQLLNLYFNSGLNLNKWLFPLSKHFTRCIETSEAPVKAAQSLYLNLIFCFRVEAQSHRTQQEECLNSIASKSGSKKRLKVRVTLLRVRITKTSDSLKFSFCNFASSEKRSFGGRSLQNMSIISTRTMRLCEHFE